MIRQTVGKSLSTANNVWITRQIPFRLTGTEEINDSLSLSVVKESGDGYIVGNMLST